MVSFDMARDDGIKHFGAYQVRHDRMPDENLDNLIGNWRDYNERLVLFLGSGASAGARNASDTSTLPTAYALRDRLWTGLMVPIGDPDLGMMTLEHAAAIIESRKGRKRLSEEVRAAFATRQPLWMHAVLPYFKPRALFTTNYDLLIEQGWGVAAARDRTLKQLLPIYGEDQRLDPQQVTLFKPHGSVERAEDALGHGRLVITLFDYFGMIASKAEMLKKWLRAFDATCAIFVGYSFMDTDIGSQLYEMRQADKSVPWYAVFPRGDAEVRRMYEQHFAIRQINRTFFELIVDLDAALNFIPPALKVDQIATLQGSELIQ